MKIYDTIKVNALKRSRFDLSHEKKLSCNMGQLVPIMVAPVVPGDRFNVNTEIMMRLAPMVAPVMHRINVYTHYYFVPNRLIYGEWEKFITGGEHGTADVNFPKIDIGLASTEDNFLFYEGSLWDYMGLPTIEDHNLHPNTQLQVSALPFRAYQLIYNEYYRDQNLIDPVAITKNSTVTLEEAVELLTMRMRAWEKDYFTGCLPWAQKGEAVSLPVESSVSYRNQALIRDENGIVSLQAGTLANDGSGNLVDASANQLNIDNIDSISGTNITINDLRRATKLQTWLEKNARAGSRYIEQILSHFGVISSDARLQRPEYLGGGKNPVIISEVLSTVASEAPQGNMSGHGISVGNTNGFGKSFEEHGYIIGIMSVLPRTAYQNGIPKDFMKFDRYDFYWPEFANLGEQEVNSLELFYNFLDDDSVTGLPFGYLPRYAEYKNIQSSVHGDFRSSLDFWHMGRKFTSRPSLNQEFVQSQPTHRVFATVDPQYNKLYVQLYNKVDAIRPMPVFGTPSL